jgi:dipeptidyl aminopeptidase/acylaminoacyl peptidase
MEITPWSVQREMANASDATARGRGAPTPTSASPPSTPTPVAGRSPPKFIVRRNNGQEAEAWLMRASPSRLDGNPAVYRI